MFVNRYARSLIIFVELHRMSQGWTWGVIFKMTPKQHIGHLLLGVLFAFQTLFVIRTDVDFAADKSYHMTSKRRGNCLLLYQ